MVNSPKNSYKLGKTVIFGIVYRKMIIFEIYFRIIDIKKIEALF